MWESFARCENPRKTSYCSCLSNSRAQGIKGLPPNYMKAPTRQTRRQFIKGSAGAAALLSGLAPTIIPASVLGQDAPSNKITIGFIGVGDHGTGWNLSYYLKNKMAKVLAVCDVDEL